MNSHTTSLVRSSLARARQITASERAKEVQLTKHSCCCEMAMAEGKKARKPYTITRPREKWTADEHDRFVHALHLFGRDWKRVAQFVVTKTATQVRSHAQKHFLKVQKLAFLPKPRSYHDNATATLGKMAPVSSVQQGVDWACTAAGACWPGHGLFMGTANCSADEQAAASPSKQEWFADMLLPDESHFLPLSPEDPRFAQVYRFIGDVFGSDAPLLDEALQGMDPVVVEAILLALRNLQVNLFV